MGKTWICFPTEHNFFSIRILQSPLFLQVPLCWVSKVGFFWHQVWTQRASPRKSKSENAFPLPSFYLFLWECKCSHSPASNEGVRWLSGSLFSMLDCMDPWVCYYIKTFARAKVTNLGCTLLLRLVVSPPAARCQVDGVISWPYTHYVCLPGVSPSRVQRAPHGICPRRGRCGSQRHSFGVWYVGRSYNYVAAWQSTLSTQSVVLGVNIASQRLYNA